MATASLKQKISTFLRKRKEEEKEEEKKEVLSGEENRPSVHPLLPFLVTILPEGGVNCYRVIEDGVTRRWFPLSPFTRLSVSDDGETIVAANTNTRVIETVWADKVYGQIMEEKFADFIPIASSPPAVIGVGKRESVLFVFSKEHRAFVACKEFPEPMYLYTEHNVYNIVNSGYLWLTTGTNKQGGYRGFLVDVRDPGNVSIAWQYGEHPEMIYTQSTRCIPQWVEADRWSDTMHLWFAIPQPKKVATLTRGNLPIWSICANEFGIAVLTSIERGIGVVAFYPKQSVCPSCVIPVRGEPEHLHPYLDRTTLFYYNASLRECVCWDVGQNKHKWTLSSNFMLGTSGSLLIASYYLARRFSFWNIESNPYFAQAYEYVVGHRLPEQWSRKMPLMEWH